MKSTLIHATAALVACAWSTCLAAVLKVGDDAPELRVSSWAQGQAVKEFEGDKVYIVEFWASWCGPCITSIPHLDEISKRHQDEGLVVIGQNLGEDAAKVSAFVKKMAEKMSYRVAVDDPTNGGWMAKQWLAAAGKNGIPCAFVVNKAGKIAYIGHPMRLNDAMLVNMLAEPSTKAAEGASAATAPSKESLALAERAANEIRTGKLDEAEATMARLQDNLAAGHSHIAGLLELQLLLARDQADDAIELSKLLKEDFPDHPELLASVAAHLISQPEPSAALLKAAENLAKPLSSSAGSAQGPALATLARIAFLSGEKDRAVELQTSALSLLAPDQQTAAKSALETYRR